MHLCRAAHADLQSCHMQPQDDGNDDDTLSSPASLGSRSAATSDSHHAAVGAHAAHVYHAMCACTAPSRISADLQMFLLLEQHDFLTCTAKRLRVEHCCFSQLVMCTITCHASEIFKYKCCDPTCCACHRHSQ